MPNSTCLANWGIWGILINPLLISGFIKDILQSTEVANKNTNLMLKAMTC